MKFKESETEKICINFSDSQKVYTVLPSFFLFVYLHFAGKSKHWKIPEESYEKCRKILKIKWI
jgi:hypothetical protein